MASEDAIVAQRLECSLCFDLMKEPKLLSCAHTFCKDCLARLYQCQRIQHQLSCPVCRQTTKLKNGDVSKLQTNVPIKAMIGDVQSAKIICTVCDPEAKSIAIAYCQMCVEYMCDSCLEAHRKFRKNKDHEVLSANDIKTGKMKMKRFCLEHPQEEKLWVCTACNTLICFRCRVIDHNDSNHKLEKVTDFQKRMKDQIESLKKKAGKKIRSFERYVKITREQDAKIEMKTDAILTEINQAYDEAIQQLTKRRNELTGKCNEYKNILKNQLRDINGASKNAIDSIKSASDLVSNGIKTILEGDTLVVHSALCCELEEMLGKGDPDNSKPVAITRQAEDLEFTRYRRERELDLGQVVWKSMWELEKLNTYPLSGMEARDMQPTPFGGMAVCYRGGGIEIFTVDRPQQTVLKNVEVVRFCFLTDGRYVVRDTNCKIIMFTSVCKQLPVKFNTNIQVTHGGLCADMLNNIYIGCCYEKKIEVFRPEGGAPIREIPCHGYKPRYIHHMNHSPLFVVTDGGSTVSVIDEEGTVKHGVAKAGYYACIGVLQDDNILIGWMKDYLLSIDLYTPQLQYVKTVLSEFNIESYVVQCLVESPTGDIAFPDKDNFHVFRKV